MWVTKYENYSYLVQYFRKWNFQTGREADNTVRLMQKKKKCARTWIDALRDVGVTWSHDLLKTAQPDYIWAHWKKPQNKQLLSPKAITINSTRNGMDGKWSIPVCTYVLLTAVLLPGAVLVAGAVTQLLIGLVDSRRNFLESLTHDVFWRGTHCVGGRENEMKTEGK